MNAIGILKRNDTALNGMGGKLSIARDDVDETFRCGAVERPWRDNQVNISCIPPGVYTVRRRDGTNDKLKYPDAWEVIDVEGRTAILFHIANHPYEVKGCLAPCSSLIFDYRTDSVYGRASELALNAMNDYLEGLTEFTLTIIE